MSTEEDGSAAQFRAMTLAAFGLKPWDIGTAPVPLRVRVWRAVTFAYRRGKAVDWRSYNAVEAEYRARQEEFEAALPGRAQTVADQLSGILPAGLRFEWGVTPEPPHTGTSDAPGTPVPP